MPTTYSERCTKASVATISELEPWQEKPLGDSFHSRVIQNQQYLYPKFPPTAVVKLLQYSGSRVEHRDGFSSYKLFVS